MRLRALEVLAEHTRRGRPTLFETHRCNFTTGATRAAALLELERLLIAVLVRYPTFAFISTERLARVYRRREPEWLEQTLDRRLHTSGHTGRRLAPLAG